MPDTTDSTNVIDKLAQSEDLIDILLDIEDYLDSNNMYAFANWIKGQVVAGPFVKKYWVHVTLKWSYDEMPDPRAARRLLAQGTRIEFEKGQEAESVEVKSPSDYQPGTKKPRIRQVPIWLVKLSIPRRFVKNVDSEVLDLYDEDVDSDTIEAAKPEELEQQPAMGADQQVLPGQVGEAPPEEPQI